MYTILMNSDKQLVQTVRINLYQRETMINKIQFLLNATYEDDETYDLSQFTWTLRYTDPGNIAHAEQLNLDVDLYKDKYLRATLPVDSELSYMAGDITLRLSGVAVIDGVTYVLNSNDTTITIQPLKNLYQQDLDPLLDPIDQRIAQVSAQIEALEVISGVYAEDLPNDLEVDVEESKMYLVHDDIRIGHGAHIMTQVASEEDPQDDGVVDLGNVVVEI